MKLWDRRFLIGAPSEEQLKSNLVANPNNFEQILDDHLSHKSYKELSKRIPKGRERFEFEWLINPFQYARQSIRDDQLFLFAKYLNKAAVWQYAAPHFLDSAASTQVLVPMLNRCPKERVQELANILNASGLLSASFQARGSSAEDLSRLWGIRIS